MATSVEDTVFCRFQLGLCCDKHNASGNCDVCVPSPENQDCPVYREVINRIPIRELPRLFSREMIKYILTRFRITNYNP
jgi:hypothetical protein